MKQPLENEEVINFISKVKKNKERRTELWNLIQKIYTEN